MEKSNITILVDIDDTIYDLLFAWCDWLNKVHKTNVSHDDITELDIQKFFPSLSKEQIYGTFGQEDFWETVKPKLNAQKYIKKLIDKGLMYICVHQQTIEILR